MNNFDFAEKGFREVSHYNGEMKITFMGEESSIPYESINYINELGTIGIARIATPEKPTSIILLSKLEDDWRLITMPASSEQQGSQLVLEDKKVILNAIIKNEKIIDFAKFYEAHLEAIKEHSLLSDKAGLETMLPNLPQEAINLVMSLMSQMLEQMSSAMGQLGETMQNMDENIGGVMKDMGEILHKPDDET